MTDARRWRTFEHGGAIRCVVFDFDGTLTTPGSDHVTVQAAQVLHRLHTDLGMTLAVASNTNTDQDRLPALHEAGVTELLCLILQSHQMACAKPSPRFFAHLLKIADLPPSSVLMVGNNLAHDVLPAVHAGMPAVLVGPTPRPPQVLPVGAARIDDIGELPDLLSQP